MNFKRDLSFLLIAQLGFSSPSHSQRTNEYHYINYQKDSEGYYSGHHREDLLKDSDGYYVYAETNKKTPSKETKLYKIFHKAKNFHSFSILIQQITILCRESLKHKSTYSTEKTSEKNNIATNDEKSPSLDLVKDIIIAETNGGNPNEHDKHEGENNKSDNTHKQATQSVDDSSHKPEKTYENDDTTSGNGEFKNVPPKETKLYKIFHKAKNFHSFSLYVQQITILSRESLKHKSTYSIDKASENNKIAAIGKNDPSIVQEGDNTIAETSDGNHINKNNHLDENNRSDNADEQATQSDAESSHELESTNGNDDTTSENGEAENNSEDYYLVAETKIENSNEQNIQEDENHLSDSTDKQATQSDDESSLEPESNDENNDTTSENGEAENDPLKDSEGYYLVAATQEENLNEQISLKDENNHSDNTDDQEAQSYAESSSEPESNNENNDTTSENGEAENNSEDYYLVAEAKAENSNGKNIQEDENNHLDNTDDQEAQSYAESSLEPESNNENNDTTSEIGEAENDPLKDSEEYYLADATKEKNSNEQNTQEDENNSSDNTDDQEAQSYTESSTEPERNNENNDTTSENQEAEHDPLKDSEGYYLVAATQEENSNEQNTQEAENNSSDNTDDQEAQSYAESSSEPDSNNENNDTTSENGEAENNPLKDSEGYYLADATKEENSNEQIRLKDENNHSDNTDDQEAQSYAESSSEPQSNDGNNNTNSENQEAEHDPLKDSEGYYLVAATQEENLNEQISLKDEINHSDNTDEQATQSDDESSHAPESNDGNNDTTSENGEAENNSEDYYLVAEAKTKNPNEQTNHEDENNRSDNADEQTIQSDVESSHAPESNDGNNDITSENGEAENDPLKDSEGYYLVSATKEENSSEQNIQEDENHLSDRTDKKTIQSDVESSLEHESNDENNDIISENEEAENDLLKDSEGYYLADATKEENSNEQNTQVDENNSPDNTDDQEAQSYAESSSEPESNDENNDTTSENEKTENESEGYYLVAEAKTENSNGQNIQEDENNHSDNTDDQEAQSYTESSSDPERNNENNDTTSENGEAENDPLQDFEGYYLATATKEEYPNEQNIQEDANHLSDSTDKQAIQSDAESSHDTESNDRNNDTTSENVEAENNSEDYYLVAEAKAENPNEQTNHEDKNNHSKKTEVHALQSDAESSHEPERTDEENGDITAEYVKPRNDPLKDSEGYYLATATKEEYSNEQDNHEDENNRSDNADEQATQSDDESSDAPESNDGNNDTTSENGEAENNSEDYYLVAEGKAENPSKQTNHEDENHLSDTTDKQTTQSDAESSHESEIIDDENGDTTSENEKSINDSFVDSEGYYIISVVEDENLTEQNIHEDENFNSDKTIENERTDENRYTTESKETKSHPSVDSEGYYLTADSKVENSNEQNIHEAENTQSDALFSVDNEDDDQNYWDEFLKSYENENLSETESNNQNYWDEFLKIIEDDELSEKEKIENDPYIDSEGYYLISTATDKKDLKIDEENQIADETALKEEQERRAQEVYQEEQSPELENSSLFDISRDYEKNYIAEDPASKIDERDIEVEENPFKNESANIDFEKETPETQKTYPNSKEKDSEIEKPAASSQEGFDGEIKDKTFDMQNQIDYQEETSPAETVETYYPGIQNSAKALEEVKNKIVALNDLNNSSSTSVMGTEVLLITKVKKEKIYKAETQVKEPLSDMNDSDDLDEKVISFEEPAKDMENSKEITYSKSISTFTTAVTAAVVGGGVSAAVFSVLFKDKNHHSSSSSSLPPPSYYDSSEPVSDSCSTCGTRKKWDKPNLTINFTSSIYGVTPFVRTPEGLIITNGDFEKTHDVISISIDDIKEGEYFAGAIPSRRDTSTQITMKVEAIHSKEGLIAEFPIEGICGNQELGFPFKVE